MFGLGEPEPAQPEEEKCPGEAKCPEFNLAAFENGGDGSAQCVGCDLFPTKPGTLPAKEAEEEPKKPPTKNELLLARVRRIRQLRISYGKPVDETKITFIESELLLFYEHALENAEREAAFLARQAMEAVPDFVQAVSALFKSRM